MTTWSNTPPSEDDVRASYNGFFWIKFQISHKEVEIDVDTGESTTWPSIEMIEPVQILYVLAMPSPDSEPLEHEKRIARGFSIKEIDLDNPEDLKGIQWQAMTPPADIPDEDED